VRRQIALDLVGVERPARLDEVEDRPLGDESQRQADVPELQIEVDDRHLLAGERQGDGEVGAREGLADAALGTQHADERRQRAGARCRAAGPAGDRLLHGEPELRRDRRRLLAVRPHDEVVGTGLERVLYEAIGRRRGEHDDRALGIAAGGLPDEPECLLGLRRAGDDHDVAVLLAERRPALLQAREHGRDLDAARVREDVADARLVRAGVERDERGNGFGHQKSPL
jgi:hypothetical protein